MRTLVECLIDNISFDKVTAAAIEPVVHQGELSFIRIGAT